MNWEGFSLIYWMLVELKERKSIYTAGVPQGGAWSPILFNLYIRLLGNQVLCCDLFQCADDASLMKVVRTKEEWIKAAEEMNADLNCVYFWGRPWNINFEPTKCFSLCVSLKRDIDHHSPLYMASLPIQEVESLKILGFYFDSNLTWNTMISQLSTRFRQCMGALYRVREYLGPRGLTVAFGSLSDLYVSTAVLHSWVLQLPIYQSLIRYRSWLKQ